MSDGQDVKRGSAGQDPTFCEEAMLALRVSSSVLLVTRSAWSTWSCSAWAFSYTQHKQSCTGGSMSHGYKDTSRVLSPTDMHREQVHGMQALQYTYYRGTWRVRVPVSGCRRDCIYNLLDDCLLSCLQSFLHLPPHSLHLILGCPGHRHLPSHFCILQQTQTRTDRITIILKTECSGLCGVWPSENLLLISHIILVFVNPCATLKMNLLYI